MNIIKASWFDLLSRFMYDANKFVYDQGATYESLNRYYR